MSWLEFQDDRLKGDLPVLPVSSSRRAYERVKSGAGKHECCNACDDCGHDAVPFSKHCQLAVTDGAERRFC